MKKEFYEKLLPSTGVYCAATLSNGLMRNRFAENLEDLIEITDNYNTEGGDVLS